VDNKECNELFSQLSTPMIADACIRLKLPVRSMPAGLTSLIPGSKVAGRALPVRHYGSVDIFLEAMLQAKPGDILCIDDRGRNDQACIGDLTALEAMSYGIAALLVWGCHRDTDELMRIGLPIFSYGRHPSGPQKLEPAQPDSIGSAKLAGTAIDSNDFVFIDSDGAVFVHQDHIKDVFATAKQICEVESKQAQLVRDGKNLHRQLMFEDFLKKRVIEPTHTFREHLRALAKSIEE
jgi:regulator of RNase E activity RraA